MFPFIFKLWRYHGLPTVNEVPDITGAAPVAVSTPVASSREAEMDDVYTRAQLQKTWQERYLPRLWGSPHARTAAEPRVILAVDDGESAFDGALKTADFLARTWGASLVESPILGAPDDVFRIAASEGADWLVVGHVPRLGKEAALAPSLAESLARETRLPLLADRNGSLASGARRILIPVDGTAASLVSVAEGLRWARSFGSELLVFHVAEGNAEKETEHEVFLNVLQTIRWESVAHETRTGRGTVADAVLEAARSGNADLILMTTRQASIALEVMRRSPAPVFILHGEENH